MHFLLHRTVERISNRTPERDAVRCAGLALSYGQLVERASRLARVLTERGVRRGDRVGILSRKSLESAVSMYGIMQTGAAYVPLDSMAPTDRLAVIARDCGIRHLVSEPSQRKTVRALIDTGVPLDTVIGFDDASLATNPGVAWEQVASAPLLSPIDGLTEMDVSYILYTSGSTGLPKGVMHTHRSALAFAQAAAETYALRAEDRVTSHAPLHFDLSTLDFFATAVVGGTTVIVPEAYTKLPASLSQLLADERATVLYAVPMALTQLVLHGALEERDLTALRWVIFAGEPFAPKHLRALTRALPGAHFSNIYGPTEVNGVTYWMVPPTAALPDDPLPIGRAFENVDLRVVTDSGSEARAGETGELWVRSATMMQGYWGRPDLDETSFATISAGGARPLRFHRTGDLVRTDAEGVMHFLGRMDRQIKTRGYRVELDEVESALVSHPLVEGAAVFGVPDDLGSTAVEAVVVLVPGATASTSELLSFASTRLPRYALPQHMQIVDVLPRTATEKIDRMALRTQALVRRQSASAGRA
jgi:amino acid adenylation domain-containing protein